MQLPRLLVKVIDPGTVLHAGPQPTTAQPNLALPPLRGHGLCRFLRIRELE
jgi:hypothetical protein